MRPLLARALAVAEAVGVDVGVAVDLGAGDGTETLALLDRGWSVLAVDAEPTSAAALAAAAPPGAQLTVVTRDMADVDLPQADLVLAAFSLFFLPPPRFDLVWDRLRASLRPGGVVAAHLLLERDTWAALPRITAMSVDEARRRSRARGSRVRRAGARRRGIQRAEALAPRGADRATAGTGWPRTRRSPMAVVTI